MAPFEVLRPEALDEVLEILAHSEPEEAVLWGGGTATALLMKQGLLVPRRLIALEGVAALRGLRVDEAGHLHLGATTRLRELERSPLLRERLPCLAETASWIGNVRVRNVATLGGHLVHADPAQDLPPLLLALDARVRLASRQGQRVLPLTDFFVDTLRTAIGPDEVLVEVEVPAEALARRTRYVKYTPRSRDDYATVGVACSLEVSADGVCRQARIAVGGAGPTAVRLPQAEAVLQGEPLTAARCREAAALAGEGVEPWDDLRGSAAYKRAMTRVWVERLLVALAAEAAPARA